MSGLIYDDLGCVVLLPYGYDRKLEKLGIQCKVFNPFIPFISVRMNNRDHRKIVVIDGHTAFTGGINLADEYINAYEKYGHWKDTGVMVKGEAVWNFTVMFLTLWDFLTKTREPDYERFRPQVYHPEPFAGEGFVAPFTDSPMDGETVGENVYYNLIAHASHYVYITTPYLILDYEMTNALCTAAKSGVDVRIITPYVWDKFMVYMLTQSNYPALLEAGVKIYEYTPGFVHAKSFVVDDELATVGTINLDYRSLYLHFECGCWMYKTPAVMDIKADLLKTMEECHRFTMEDYHKLPLYRRLGGKLLKAVCAVAVTGVGSHPIFRFALDTRLAATVNTSANTKSIPILNRIGRKVQSLAPPWFSTVHLSGCTSRTEECAQLSRQNSEATPPEQRRRTESLNPTPPH